MRVNKNDEFYILERTIALVNIRNQAFNPYAIWNTSTRYNHPRINSNSQVTEGLKQKSAMPADKHHSDMEMAT